MSKYQQIRVRVEPVYKKGFDAAFPRLYKVLLPLEPSLAETSPALYHLVPLLVRLSQKDELEDNVAEALDAHGQTILDLRTKVEDAIGGWKLGKAEGLLIELEEAFANFEQALPDS